MPEFPALTCSTVRNKLWKVLAIVWSSVSPLEKSGSFQGAGSWKQMPHPLTQRGQDSAGPSPPFPLLGKQRKEKGKGRSGQEGAGSGGAGQREGK